MRNTIIGTGFYCTRANREERLRFLGYWLHNAITVSDRIVIVDNSEHLDAVCVAKHPVQVIPLHKNLGHVCDDEAKRHLLAGWSMSWIIPAMIAYAEDCDFVYMEQDCLAFNDWLPAIRQARFSFGNHERLECEQSLFWIERDFIPTVVQVYMSIPENDVTCIPERKFKLIEGMLGGSVARHNVGPGRGRPLPIDSKEPWSAQKFAPDDLASLVRRYGLDKP